MNLKKKRDNPRSKYWLHKADAAWGQWVHEHYSACAIGSGCAGRLEAHHLISRAIRATRHDPNNSILLCSLHHKYSPHCSPHGAPLQFAAWLQKTMPGKWDWTQAHQNDWKTVKADYREAYNQLSGISH